MSKNCLALIVTAQLFLFASCRPQITPATGFGYWSSDEGFQKTLEQQETGSNGIEVGELKIYDDASLRIMLNRAKQRLASLYGLDQATLTGHLGAVTGYRVDQSQVGLQVAGPSLPGVVTTAKGAVAETSTAPEGVTAVAKAPTQEAITTVAPTSPPPAPSVPAGLAVAPPTAISGSALDLLNEQMQLTYEIANLELLLEGAISDRFIANQRIIKPRATVGFPIAIAPQPRYKDAVAVVEVEVETAHPPLSDEAPSITALLPQERTYNVAALTDRTTSIGGGAVIGTVGVSGSWSKAHKTYYLVQDQDTIAIQRPSQRPSVGHERAVSFAWEFRPVLGQRFVRRGMKQTFVQLAFPRLDDLGSNDCQGIVRVRTYWREFDQKTGISKGVIKGSVLSRDLLAVPHFDLTPKVGGITYQDLGNGTLLVKAKGNFLSGTYVQLGPTRYDEANGLLIQEAGLSFVAPADALARWTGQVVARDGRSGDLLFNSVQKHLPKLDQFSCLPKPKQKEQAGDSAASMLVEDAQITSDSLEIKLRKGASAPGQTAGVGLEDIQGKTRVDLASSVVSYLDGDRAVLRVAMAPQPPSCRSGSIRIKNNGISITPLSETTSLVKVEFEPIEPGNFLSKLSEFPDDVLLDIGHKVFGLADTTVERDLNKDAPSITAAVPTSLLVSGGRVRAFRMFRTAPDGEQAGKAESGCFNSSKDLPGFELDSAVERLILVGADKDKATYLLYGNGLEEPEVIPKDATVKLVAIENLPKDRVRLLTIPSDKLSAMNKLVLQKKKDGRPLVLDLPKPEAKPAEPPKVTLDSPVVQNTDELEASVERVGDLKSVKVGSKALKFTPGKDSIRLTNLKGDGVTTEQKTQELTFEFNDETKVKVKLEVVAARVGVTGGATNK